MTLDWDGKIRMDPSSPYAMQRLIGLKDRYRHRLRLRHRSRSAWHRHRQQRLDAAESLPVGGHRLSVPPAPRLACGCCGRQDRGEQRDDRSGRPAPRAQCVRGAGGLQMVRRGAGGRHAWDSAARKAPAPRSAASTAASGPPTRMAWCRRCWRRRSPRAPAAIPAMHYRALTQDLGACSTDRVDAPANVSAKAEARPARSAQVRSARARRRAHRSDSDQGAGQQRADRRRQGHLERRLVRRASVGNRRHLQDLCRELS